MENMKISILSFIGLMLILGGLFALAFAVEQQTAAPAVDQGDQQGDDDWYVPPEPEYPEQPPEEEPTYPPGGGHWGDYPVDIFGVDISLSKVSIGLALLLAGVVFLMLFGRR
jgi:uncharacterized membrane protein